MPRPPGVLSDGVDDTGPDPDDATGVERIDPADHLRRRRDLIHARNRELQDRARELAERRLHGPRPDEEPIDTGPLFARRLPGEQVADAQLDRAELVLARGWIHDLTINTMAPSPASETSQDGKLALDLGPIAAGQTYVLFIDYQVNPTNVGRQDQTVTLYDGNRSLVTLHRTLTVFP